MASFEDTNVTSSTDKKNTNEEETKQRMITVSAIQQADGNTENCWQNRVYIKGNQENSKVAGKTEDKHTLDRDRGVICLYLGTSVSNL